MKSEYSDYIRVTELNKFTAFSSTSNALLKNLHLEQASALRYLKNAADAPSEKELLARYVQTDSANKQFQSAFGHMSIHYPMGNGNILDYQHSVREGIRHRTITENALLNYYEMLSEYFLSTFEHYRIFSKDERIVTFSTLLKDLLMLKERSFQERSLLHAIFASKTMTQDQHRQFSRLLVAQNSLEGLIDEPLEELHASGVLAEHYIQDASIDSYRQKIHALDEKQQLFSELKAVIGYGGLVHTFKNYLLRGEQSYYDRFIADYPEFLRLLNDYQARSFSNQDEYTDLLILEEIFAAYRKNLDIIKQMRLQGYSREAIDKVVRIDDSIAANALVQLPKRALDIEPQLWLKAAGKRLKNIETLEAEIFKLTQKRISLIRDEAWGQLRQHLFVNSLMILLLLGLTHTLAQHIIRSVKTVQDGMNDFFDYISFKRHNPPKILLNSHDELALMAEETNRQIESIRQRIEQDEIFIFEATDITSKMRDGNFDVAIPSLPVSPSLLKLHSVLSELITLIQAKIGEQTEALEQINRSLSHKVEEQTRSLQAKFQEVHQFKLAIEQTMLICSVSTEGIVSEANSSFCKALHYHEVEVIGRDMFHFLEASQRDKLKEIFQSLPSEGNIYQGMLSLMNKEGMVVYTDSAIAPIFDAEGKIREYICFYHNISPIIEARDKAIAAEKAKDEFLSNMSHEIRTPLNAILGFVGILKKRIKDEKELHYLDVIANSGTSLLAIINDILDFAKIQSGKFQISPFPFEPVEELSQAALLFASKAFEKKISYLVYIDPNLPHCLYADLVRIKQVLSNLLSNAIKFTPEHGTIKVRISVIGQTLHMLVQDSGIGIDKAAQERIFQAFEQADGSTTREFGGTGLGLSITARLIELMQGEIELKSEKNKGSTFKVAIPFESCEELRRIEHNYDKIRSLKVALAAPDESKRSLMQLIRHYLQDFGISAIKELSDIRDNPADLIIFIPDETITAQIVASDQPAIALLEEAENPFRSNRHIYPLHAPFVPTAVMEALDDATIERLRGFKETAEELLPQFEGEILVVEDNLTNQMLITLMLEEYGLHFEVANDGLQGVSKAKEKRYDLILMDENMPNLNGLEAMKQIKAYEKEHNLVHTPIVALTANVMQGDRERFMQAGMDGFIGKPINNAELEEVLKKFVGVR